MTLYLDTSSLVKLYVTESGSEVVRQLVGDADVVATSVVAYAETRALSRGFATKECSPPRNQRRPSVNLTSSGRHI